MRLGKLLLKTCLAVLLAIGVATTTTRAQEAGLVAYVKQEDPSFGWEVQGTESVEGATVSTIALQSQTWRGIPWQHWLTVVRPAEVRHPEDVFLLIYGGDIDDAPPRLGRTELRVLQQVSKATGTVTALLNQVPNQPLFDGLYEDALISFTYEKFLAEGGNWPLLYPMAKSAVAAMDAIQQFISQAHQQEVKHFMTCGGSKRGWTTWLSAVADPRVKRIAPMIIDMLNTPEQMKHMLATYGGYTESIGDYTQRSIQDRMLAGEGKFLTSQVDPYSWRDKLTLPKLVVLGTNDPYWTVDAANLYFEALQGEKHLYYQANTGHDASMGGIATITEFYNAMVTGERFPSIDWQTNDAGALVVSWEKPGGTASLWTASSPNRDFRNAEWVKTPLEGDGEVTVTLEKPDAGWAARYVEVNWPGIIGLPFGLTTQMYVLPIDYPAEGTRTYDQPVATE